MIKPIDPIRCVVNAARYVKYLIERQGPIEIRVLAGVKRTYAGYFKSAKGIFKAVEPLSMRRKNQDGTPKIDFGDYARSGEAIGIYYPLNAITPELYATSAETIKWSPTTVTDSNIIRRTHILIDADPARPNSNISSSRKEKHYAAGVIRKVHHELKSKGICSLTADSGNGFHEIIPIDYPNTPDMDNKIRAFLMHLNNKFGTPKVSIDTIVFNAGRISKLYGTMSCKGSDFHGIIGENLIDPEEARPHRMSQVRFPSPLWGPEDRFVPVDVLSIYSKEIDEILAEVTRTTPPTDFNGSSRNDRINQMRDVLNKEGHIFREFEKDGRYHFKFEKCPVHCALPSDHPNADDGATYECSVMIGDEGHISTKCHHSEEYHWNPHFKEAINWSKYVTSPIPGDVMNINEFFTPGEEIPRAKNLEGDETTNQTKEDAASPKRTANESMNFFYNILSYPKVEYLIPSAKIFPRKSITQMAGEPGCMKSTVTVDSLLNMINGSPVLGQFFMPKIKCFYVQSDNDASYFMNRVALPLGYDPLIHRNNLLFYHTKSIPDFNMTGFQILCEEAAKNFDLIVIDNKTSLFPNATYGDKAQVKSMELVVALKKIAIKYNIAILIIEHIRKPTNRAYEPITQHDILESGAKLAEQSIGLNRRFDEIKHIIRYDKRDGSPIYGNPSYKAREGEGVMMGLKNAEGIEWTKYKYAVDEPVNSIVWEPFDSLIVTEEKRDRTNKIPSSNKTNEILKYFLDHPDIEEFTLNSLATWVGLSLNTTKKYFEYVHSSTLGLFDISKFEGGGRGKKRFVKIVDRSLLNRKFGEDGLPEGEFPTDIKTEVNLDETLNSL